MGSWGGAGLIFESKHQRLGALVFTLAGWGWGSLAHWRSGLVGGVGS